MLLITIGWNRSRIIRTGILSMNFQQNTRNKLTGKKITIKRQKLFESVMRVLNNPCEKGVVLFGSRCIGKTSFLLDIESNLSQQSEFIPLYFDLKQKSALPLEELVLGLAEKLSEKNNLPPWQIKKNLTASFYKDYLKKALQQIPESSKIVFIFDEFNVIDNPKSNQSISSFYPYLTWLISLKENRIKYIVTIGGRPSDLFDIYLFYLKNLRFLQISFLDLKENCDLIRSLESHNHVKWPDHILLKMYDFTKGHPVFIKKTCLVMENKRYGENPEYYYNEILDNANASLEKIWQGLSNAEKIFASAIAEQGPGIAKIKDIEESLQKSGASLFFSEMKNTPQLLIEWEIIQQEYSGYSFVIEIFRKWVAKYKNLQSIKENITQITPVSDNLVQAAYVLFKQGDIQEAAQAGRQAVKLNPDHIEASQLLADILVAQDNINEALQLLKGLYQKDPEATRKQLINLMLLESKTLEELYSYDFDDYLYSSEKNKNLRYIKIRFAKKQDQEDHLLGSYENILKLEPENKKIVAKYIKLIKKHQKINEIKQQVSYENDVLNQSLDAYMLTEATKKIKEIQKKLQLNNLYLNALEALNNQDRQQARDLLGRVLYMDSGFVQAKRFLYLVNNDKNIHEVNDYRNVSRKKDIPIIKPEAEIDNETEEEEKINEVKQRPFLIKCFLVILIAILYFFVFDFII